MTNYGASAFQIFSCLRSHAGDENILIIIIDIYSYFSHSDPVPFHRGLAHDGDQGGREYGPVKLH